MTVGLVLGVVLFFGVAFTLLGRSKPADATGGVGVTATTADSGPRADRLEKACGVLRTLEPKYVVHETQDTSYPGVPRVKLVVTVPLGLTREELDANMRHACLIAYEKNGDSSLGAVTVNAWAGESTEGAYSAAMATFAPDGDLKKADPGAMLEHWAVKVDFATGYFDAKPAVIGIGTAVTLTDENAPTVSVSRSASSWGDADIITRVPRGTKARVLAMKSFNGGAGTPMVRYDVELSGGKQRGWVMGSYVHVCVRSSRARARTSPWATASCSLGPGRAST
jgi:hypothetical protein